MPWHIPEELKYFKSLTEDNIIVMGRKTFQSLNFKALPNRINIIISKTLEPPKDNTYIVLDSIEEAIRYAEDLGVILKREVFIIGGSEIYQQTFNKISKIYLSIVKPTEAKLLNIETHNRNDISFYIARERISRYFDLESSSVLDILDKNFKVIKYVLNRK